MKDLQRRSVARMGWFIWISVLLLPTILPAQRLGDVPYSEAVYEVSKAPDEVVLQVQTGSASRGTSRSMTVYGDGIVELRESRNGQELRAGRVTLSPAEAKALVDSAVHGGLAEWDHETILAWIRRDSAGAVPIVEDGGSVRISLTLESYRRGSITRAPLSRTFSVSNPDAYAEMFPDIPQFMAATRLWQTLRARLSQIPENEP